MISYDLYYVDPHPDSESTAHIQSWIGIYNVYLCSFKDVSIPKSERSQEACIVISAFAKKHLSLVLSDLSKISS